MIGMMGLGATTKSAATPTSAELDTAEAELSARMERLAVKYHALVNKDIVNPALIKMAAGAVVLCGAMYLLRKKS